MSHLLVVVVIIMQQEQRRPLECVFCRSEQRFRVIRAKGKTLASGGFGFIEVLNKNNTSILQQEPSQKATDDDETRGGTVASGEGSVTENGGAESGESSRHEEVKQQRCSSTDETSTQPIKRTMIAYNNNNDKTEPAKQKGKKEPEQRPNHYLFLEEVIYLHERGLLHAFLVEGQSEATKQQQQQSQNHQTAAEKQQPLQLSDLYKLLPVCNLPMATYLVYQHVRAQTFRVVRHSPYRRAILEAMQERIQSGPPPSRQRMQEQDKQLKQKSEDTVVLMDDENCEGGDHYSEEDNGGVNSEAAASMTNADDYNSPQHPAEKKQKTLNGDSNSNGLLLQSFNPTKEEMNGSEQVHPNKDNVHHDSNENDDGGNRSPGDDSSSKAPTEQRDNTSSISRKARSSWWKRDPEFRRLSLQLRVEASRAPPPQPNVATMAFDCYNPNANFSRTNPGLPDFYVAISFYSQSPAEGQQSFSFHDLQTILALASSSYKRTNGDAATGTPSATTSVTVKVATVSDSGTVIMFGVSDYGVPIMEQPVAKK